MVVSLEILKGKPRPRLVQGSNVVVKCSGCGKILMSDEKAYHVGKLRVNYTYRGFKINSKGGYPLKYYGDCCVNKIYVDGEKE